MDRASFTDSQLYRQTLAAESQLCFPLTHKDQDLYQNGVVLRGRDLIDPKTSHPESKYLQQRATREIGPIFVSFKKYGLWDFSRLDIKTYIAPYAFLTPYSSQMVGRQIGKQVTKIINMGVTNQNASINGLTAQQKLTYKLCKLKMLDLPSQIRFFEDVGKMIKAELSASALICLADKKVTDYLSVKEGFINYRLNSNQKRQLEKNLKEQAKTAVGIVCTAQKYLYAQPNGKKGEDFVKAMAPEVHGKLLKAFGKLAQGGLQVQTAPEFIGFVPSQIADPIAAKAGFIDSNWSANFLHGKYSHLLALTFLSREANLTTNLLKVIVDEKLWGDLLDHSPYAEVNIEKIKAFEYMIHDRNPYTRPFNPFAFQEMLSTGQVSSTLRQLAAISKELPDDQHTMLSEAFKERITPERLNKMAENVQFLEHAIALEHHDDLLKIKKYFTLPTFGLVPLEYWVQSNGGTLGQFPNLEQSDEIAAFAARKALEKGHTVVGVSEEPHKGDLLRHLFSCKRFTEHTIHKASDLKREPPFMSYIVWPKH